jgi:hypothetical protein
VLLTRLMFSVFWHIYRRSFFRIVTDIKSRMRIYQVSCLKCSVKRKNKPVNGMENFLREFENDVRMFDFR